MRTIFSAFILLFITTGTVFAQQSPNLPEGVNIKQVISEKAAGESRLTPYFIYPSFLNLEGNVARIEQDGQNHKGVIKQQGFNNIGITHTTGADLMSTLYQKGSRNNAYLGIWGNHNEVSVKQWGNENYFDMELEGSNNFIELLQQGDKNIYERMVIGGGDLNESVIQFGDNNTSTQIGSLSGGRSANIVQEGNGLGLIIIHD